MIPAKTLPRAESSEQTVSDASSRLGRVSTFSPLLSSVFFCCKQRGRNLEAASEFVPVLSV